MAARNWLPEDPSNRSGPVLPVPEIRDYQQINAQVIQNLGAGHRWIRLAGVEGQRLLLSGLNGPWNALIEVEGCAGPELAADLEAPGLTVVCLGAVADGAGRDLREGRLLILGEAGDCLGYHQRGGVIVAASRSGHRAGLEQAGGLLLLGGPIGRLGAERQSGGRIVLLDAEFGPNLAFGRRGGRLIAPGLPDRVFERPDLADWTTMARAIDGLEPWLPPGFLERLEAARAND